MIACAVAYGKPELKRDSNIKINTQLFDNAKVFNKTIPSYAVFIETSLNPKGFNDRNTLVAKFSFKIKSYYKLPVSVYIIPINCYHVWLHLDDNKYTALSYIDNFDFGYQGTAIGSFDTGVSVQPLVFSNLTEFKFFLRECSNHLNMYQGIDVIICFNNDYYYKYHSWKTSSTNYGLQFVTKGKYYEGLVPNL